MSNNFKIHGSVDKDFTKVPKSIIKDTSISVEARILLAFLIDLTGDFSINEHGLSTILGISVYRVGKAISELEDAGYIFKKRIMNKTQFAGWFWNISLVPIFKSDNPYLDFSDMENSDTSFSDMENSDTKNSVTSFSDMKNQPYIKDRKDIRPKDTRPKECKTEESVCTPTFPPINPSGESIITPGELNIQQAFNRFCEVYPRIGDRKQAQAVFFKITDISNICWQIVQSVEWFEKLKRWDDWQTGQKNKYCPQAVKFLQREDWQEYMRSEATIPIIDQLDALFPDEEDEI